MIATESIGAQHEPVFLTRVRLRAQRRLLWLQKIWSPQLTEGAAGLAITPAEVDQIVMSPEERLADERSFYLGNDEARHLGDQIREIDQKAWPDAAWQQLRDQFDLSPEEIDLLTVAVAADFNPSLRRVYGYLHDDANLCYATQWVASCLFEWQQPNLLGPNSNLVKWRLASPLPEFKNRWAINVPWTADQFVTSWLAFGEPADDAIQTDIEIIHPGDLENKACLYQDQLAAMQSFVRAMRNRTSLPNRSCTVIEIVGAAGAGKRVLAAQLCATLGCGLIVADASALANVDTPAAEETIARVARLARLHGASIYWNGAEAVNSKVWKAAANLCDLMIFGCETPPPLSDADAALQVVRLPRLTSSSRLDLWQSLTNEPAPPTITEWTLTPIEIVRAARVATAGPEMVLETCRQMLYQTPGELFVPLVCPYTWDDIVLTSNVRGHLAELEEQARLRRAVYEEWGFDKLVPLGRGITALFAGPSGTGKTMAAQVLARALKLELYRVDLAGVVNKYIGETEKRLKRVFDSCERANVLLFFDEADALFGQRTQVKDAHDRFANIEIDYLLQRMEQFDGLAILATNRKNDIDKAFLRRLRFIVDFLEPGPNERLALWHHALLERTPDGQPLLDEIDWEFLANKLTMTGADIKAAALAAAFRARGEGCRIAMRHVLDAARREMTKHGVVLRAGDLT
jgi:uridine kinase